MENIERVVWHNDLPIVHGCPTVHWLLYQKIKSENDNRKVIIEEQGGDEIVCGYEDFYWASLNKLLCRSPLKFIGRIKIFQSSHH